MSNLRSLIETYGEHARLITDMIKDVPGVRIQSPGRLSDPQGYYSLHFIFDGEEFKGIDKATINTACIAEIKKLLDSELDHRRLWTALPPEETSRRLLELYRQSRTDLEEGGVNTLFLAVGFLEWKVSERDSKSYCAPILLIPIRMQRKSILEGMRISRLDEETVINATLLELLRSQFQLTVPGVSPLPTDASGVDVATVMQIFRQTIREMKGWEVREEARIGRFSFGKFIMWHDMTARRDDLAVHCLKSL